MRNPKKLEKDGEIGELTLGSSYSYALININSSVGSPRGQYIPSSANNW